MKLGKRFWSLGLKKQAIILGLLGLSFLTGCATPSQAPYAWGGAGIGTALGAGLGAAINHSNPWRGAAIGGLLGGGGGALAGVAYGQSQTPYQPQQQGAYQPQPTNSNSRAIISRSREVTSSRATISRPPITGLRRAEPPEENRIPPDRLVQGKALASKSRQGFSLAKIKKKRENLTGQPLAIRPGSRLTAGRLSILLAGGGVRG